MRVQRFLSSGKVETTEDIELQTQLFAYIVAKHYSISLHEVYNMSEPIFRQSLSWALAINEEERLEQKKQKVSESDDTVEFDYTFLEMEEF